MPILGRRGKQTVPDGALACPRDGAVLEKTVVEGVTIDRCGACRGVWFDEGELRRVSGDRQVEKEASRERRVPLLSPFACPRCGGACHVAAVQEVQVDACSKCRGVWLDGGELEEAKRQVATERLIAEVGPDLRRFLRRV